MRLIYFFPFVRNHHLAIFLLQEIYGGGLVKFVQEGGDEGADVCCDNIFVFLYLEFYIK